MIDYTNLNITDSSESPGMSNISLDDDEEGTNLLIGKAYI